MLECIQPRFRHAVCGIATAESGETRSGSPLLDEVTAGAVYVGREGRQCDTHWSQRSAVDGRPRLDGGQPAVFHLWRRKTGRGARYVGMDLKTSATRWNVYPRCFLFLVPFPASQLCTSTTTSFFLDSLTLCHLLCSHSLSVCNGSKSSTLKSQGNTDIPEESWPCFQSDERDKHRSANTCLPDPRKWNNSSSLVSASLFRPTQP